MGVQKRWLWLFKYKECEICGEECTGLNLYGDIVCCIKCHDLLSVAKEESRIREFQEYHDEDVQKAKKMVEWMKKIQPQKERDD